MKITAVIPDNVISDVEHYARGKNLTESMIAALKEWIAIKHIKELNKSIEETPLEFNDNLSAESIRNINRE